MKTKFLKISLLCFSLLFLFVSCGERAEKKIVWKESFSNELEGMDIPDEVLKQIDDFFENYNDTRLEVGYDFCHEKKLLIGERYYDTRYGIAYYIIPVPKGSSLKRTSKSNNKVTYESTGKVFSNDIIYKPIFISGLRKIQGDQAYIEVDYSKFDDEDCNTKAPFKQERKKGSVIGGHPFID